MTCAVYKNGVASAGTDDYASWTGNISYAADDLITVCGSRTASLAGAVSIQAIVSGTVEY